MSNEREIGWLIERKYSNVLIGTTEPRWYAERANGDHWWTPVPNEAKRFATKAGAEAYTAYQMIAGDPDISITEHVWINDGFGMKLDSMPDLQEYTRDLKLPPVFMAQVLMENLVYVMDIQKMNAQQKFYWLQVGEYMGPEWISIFRKVGAFMAKADEF